MLISQSFCNLIYFIFLNKPENFPTSRICKECLIVIPCIWLACLCDWVSMLDRVAIITLNKIVIVISKVFQWDREKRKTDAQKKNTWLIHRICYKDFLLVIGVGNPYRTRKGEKRSLCFYLKKRGVIYVEKKKSVLDWFDLTLLPTVHQLAEIVLWNGNWAIKKKKTANKKGKCNTHRWAKCIKGDMDNILHLPLSGGHVQLLRSQAQIFCFKSSIPPLNWHLNIPDTPGNTWFDSDRLHRVSNWVDSDHECQSSPYFR